jgi:transposase-like protein
MKKWGTSRSGSIRWRCKRCGTSSTRKRPDLRQKYKKQLFVNSILGKASLKEIAQKYRVSRQSLHVWFAPCWNEEPQPKQGDNNDGVLIIDGKYVEKNAAVLIATTKKSVVS